MTEIAHYTGYGQMHVSRSVKQLLAHGFVVRAKDRFDRRKNIIELTELGRSVNKKLSAGAKAMEKELLSHKFVLYRHPHFSCAIKFLFKPYKKWPQEFLAAF